MKIAPDRPEHAKFEIRLATKVDREAIYRLRHEVYAREIGQHEVNQAERITDLLDESNLYLVAASGTEIAGFISLTPPECGCYSIDKYFARSDLPFATDEGLYEIRLLTVRKPYRGSRAAALLAYAALRWIEAHGGTHVAAIGRHELLTTYLEVGFAECGRQVRSGAVLYHLLHAPRQRIRDRMGRHPRWLDLLERRTHWVLDFHFRQPAACFHGGAFFDAVGPRFDKLQKVTEIINADVLDAWFPPAPAVLAALTEHLPWLLRTSPPTGCEGLVETIASERGVKPCNILAGSGSSDLIFRALPR